MKEEVEIMEAKYISPFTDFGFKKLFGEEGNKKLLISFLNSLLPIKSKIVDLTFKKNEQIGEDLYSRSAVFDVFCEDEAGTQFIVEMQNARQTYYRDRAVFYSTFPIREQAQKGKWNFKLKEVYCIGLLGFNFDDKNSKEETQIAEYLHTVNLKDQNNEVFYKKLNFIFVELPKFEKTESEVKTLFDKWLYFLKNLEDFEHIPMILNEEVFVDAFEVAELAKYNKQQREEYEASLKAFRDNINVIETAREEGEKLGEKKKALNIARNLIKLKVDNDVISISTGITKEEVDNLVRE